VTQSGAPGSRPDDESSVVDAQICCEHRVRSLPAVSFFEPSSISISARDAEGCDQREEAVQERLRRGDGEEARDDEEQAACGSSSPVRARALAFSRRHEDARGWNKSIHDVSRALAASSFVPSHALTDPLRRAPRSTSRLLPPSPPPPLVLNRRRSIRSRLESRRFTASSTARCTTASTRTPWGR
jgi:hypothetical protein